MDNNVSPRAKEYSIKNIRGMLLKAKSLEVLARTKKYIRLSNWYGKPLLPVNEVRTKIDKGKPHISVNKAIINAVVIPLCFHFFLPTIPFRKKSRKKRQYNAKKKGSISIKFHTIEEKVIPSNKLRDKNLFKLYDFFILLFLDSLNSSKT